MFLGTLTLLSSINTKMKGFIRKSSFFTRFKGVGSYIKMKYLLIFSANTPNLQWLECGLVLA